MSPVSREGENGGSGGEELTQPNPDKAGFIDTERPIVPSGILQHASARDRALEFHERAIRNIPRRYRGIYRQAAFQKSRKSAMRIGCLQCVGWSEREVRDCTSIECISFLFRD